MDLTHERGRLLKPYGGVVRHVLECAHVAREKEEPIEMAGRILALITKAHMLIRKLKSSGELTLEREGDLGTFGTRAAAERHERARPVRQAALMS